MSRGKLRPEDERCIQENYLHLKENLDALHIVDYLFQHLVINLDDKEKIYKHGLTTMERNEIMLSRLLAAGPDDSFNYFLKSLEKEYQGVLKHIERTAKEQESYEYVTNENKQLKNKLDLERVKTKNLIKENELIKSTLAEEEAQIESLQTAYTLTNKKLASEQAKIEILQRENVLTIERLAEELGKMERLQNENRIAKETLATEQTKNEKLQMEITLTVEKLAKEHEKIERLQKEKMQKLNTLATETSVNCTENNHSGSKLQNNIKKYEWIINGKKELYGHHEIELFMNGERDIHNRLSSCTKNGDHGDFINVETFSIHDLPVGYRYQPLYELIKLLADLTVRVDVWFTSFDRPEFIPGTDITFPFSEIRGSSMLRTGSGFVVYVLPPIGLTAWALGIECCSCPKCKQSNSPSTDFWVIYVKTARDLVYDKSEGKQASCKLFYHNEDHFSTLINTSDFEENKSTGTVCLLYTTCDEELGTKFEQKLFEYEEHCKRLKNFKEADDRKIVSVVSHPHGGTKKISFGVMREIFQVKSIVKEKKRQLTYKLQYTAKTCLGCSGAPVYFLGVEKNDEISALVHSGTLQNGINYSENVETCSENVKVKIKKDKASCILM